MKNTFGSKIAVTLFGESHGAAVGAVIDGLPAGTPVSEEYIAAKLALRRPQGEFSTARAEADRFEILSGVVDGVSCGTPICIVIPNADVRSADYARGPARPGHADLTAFIKYGGHEDYRGGGHFSGRVTAALVAAGAVLSRYLEDKGVRICTHISEIAGIKDRGFDDLERDFNALEKEYFAVLDKDAGERMKTAILAAKAEGDSVGGVLETAITGVPAGCGEPWFDGVESVLSHVLFSIPAVKGVEFGDGFALAKMRGSEANDPIRSENGRIVTAKNSNGGVNGGITNGMPIVFRTAVKPTPTIAIQQDTVDLITGENTVITGKGRHDPCIVHRARAAADAAAAIAICGIL